jgi:hypothetical protein
MGRTGCAAQGAARTRTLSVRKYIMPGVGRKARDAAKGGGKQEEAEL